jgi:hypothetical protein
MVQLRWAHLTEQGIKAMGFKQYTFKEYKNMGHSSCDQVKIYSLIQFIIIYIYYYYLGNARCKFICRAKFAQK